MESQNTDPSQAPRSQQDTSQLRQVFEGFTPPNFKEHLPLDPLPEDPTVPYTANERLAGAAVNLASIPFPWTAPAIGLVVSGRSKFVRFQAIRSLIEQVASIVVIGSVTVASIVYSVVDFANKNFDFSKIDWKVVILKSVAIWIGLGLFALWNLINALRDAWQAWNGDMPKKMKWSERLAAKWSGLNKS